MPSFCAAINCSNVQRKGTNLSFFRFPKDSARCRRWVINCRRADLDKKSCDELHKNYYLCAKHFEDNQFTNILHKWLIWTAIPTIFYVSNPPLQITSKRRLPVRHSFPDVATVTDVLAAEMSPDAHPFGSVVATATDVHVAQLSPDAHLFGSVVATATDVHAAQLSPDANPFGSVVATATDVLAAEMSPDAHQSSSATKVKSCRNCFLAETPRKLLLKGKIKKLQMQRWRLNRRLTLANTSSTSVPTKRLSITDIIETSCQYLTPLQQSLFTAQLKSHSIKPRGMRWSSNVKVLSKQVPEHGYSRRSHQSAFTEFKRFQELPHGGLVEPCCELLVATRIIEQLFRTNYQQLLKGAQTLYEIILPNCDFGFLYVRHPEHALYLSDKIVKMYITMRLFYAVKFKNRELLNSQSKKQVVGSDRRSQSKRKMLKILHK